MNKFAVDSRLLVGHPRGMGQYARTLTEPIKHKMTCLVPRNIEALGYETISKGASFYPWWEQYILPRLAQRIDATHLVCPSNTGPIFSNLNFRTVVVVHDLIFMRQFSEVPLSRSIYQNLGRFYRRLVVPHAIRQSDILITVSNFTKTELVEHFKLPKEKIHVIPNSLDDNWFTSAPLPDSMRQRYILCVTGEAPSKNLSTLLRAFSHIKLNDFGSKFRLKIVGVSHKFHSSFIREAKVLGISDSIDFEVYVEESDLKKMYREAWSFVLPSLFEGFGIPIIEALASGTPIACSNTSSMPEVAGPSAWLFNPKCYLSVSRELFSCMTANDRNFRASSGIEYAQRFSRSIVKQQVELFWDNIK